MLVVWYSIDGIWLKYILLICRDTLSGLCFDLRSKSRLKGIAEGGIGEI